VFENYSNPKNAAIFFSSQVFISFSLIKTIDIKNFAAPLKSFNSFYELKFE